jgi:allantoicase
MVRSGDIFSDVRLDKKRYDHLRVKVHPNGGRCNS